MKITEDTTRPVDGHYEVGKLWKKDERWFPNNIAMARQHLESLRHRLLRLGNEEMANKYHEVMDSYISSGFARKLSEKELAKDSNTQWYLPHHLLTSPTKPGKMRIVFDAAAEYEGTSLKQEVPVLKAWLLLPLPPLNSNIWKKWWADNCQFGVCNF